MLSIFFALHLHLYLYLVREVQPVISSRHVVDYWYSISMETYIIFYQDRCQGLSVLYINCTLKTQKQHSRLQRGKNAFGRPVSSRPVVNLVTYYLTVLTDSSHSSRCPGQRPSIPSTTTGSVPSLSGHAIAYLWYSPPRAHRHRSSSPQGSLSNGCGLFR